MVFFFRSAHLRPTRPPGVTVDSAAASSVHVVTESLLTAWMSQETYASIKNAVFEAAAQAPIVTTYISTIYSVMDYTATTGHVATMTRHLGEAQHSLANDGYDWDWIVSQGWYEDNVDEQWKKEVRMERDVLQNAMNRIVGTDPEISYGRKGRHQDTGTISIIGVIATLLLHLVDLVFA